MKPYRSLPILLFVLSACLGLARERPNIIFIMADDLGYGQEVIQTPHLDRMAAEDLRFTPMSSRKWRRSCNQSARPPATGRWRAKDDAPNACYIRIP